MRQNRRSPDRTKVIPREGVESVLIVSDRQAEDTIVIPREGVESSTIDYVFENCISRL